VVFRVHSVQATSNVVSSASIPGRLSFFTRVPEPHGNGWAIRAARPAAGVFLFSARRASGDARLDKNPSAFSQNCRQKLNMGSFESNKMEKKSDIPSVGTPRFS